MTEYSETITLRITPDMLKQIDELVALYPNKWKDRSELQRAALFSFFRLLKEKGYIYKEEVILNDNQDYRAY